jgi:hypothetical protein
MPETFKEGDKRLGSFYPKNCVVALLPDRAMGLKAAEALREAGFADEDVHVWGPNELFNKTDTFTDDRNLLEKFGALHSDEEKWMNEYKELMKEGESLLTVYVPDSDRLDEIRDILSPLGAEKMRHYGAMVVTDIVPGGATQ